MGLKKRIKKLVYSFKSPKLIPIIEQKQSDRVLEGKTALITGGTGGIGIEIAKKILELGAFVIIAGTNEEKLNNSLKLLDNDKSNGIILNMLDVSSFEEFLVRTVSLSPSKKIDILVNCAGVITNESFFDTKEETFDRIMDINVKGTFFLSKFVAKHMIDNKIKGHILNVSSSSALRPAWSPYHISKWAIDGFTKGLADILISYGIVVNAIAPGPTATKMLNKQDGDSIYNSTNPSGRYSTPSEVASLAAFMVSPMGDMIVGDTFYITGGSGTISLHR